MPIVTQTSTSLGALASAADGTATSVPAGTQGGRAFPTVLIVSTGVTTGATVAIEGRNAGPGPVGGNSAWRVFDLVSVTANGSKVRPLAAYADVAKIPDQLRVSTTSDGGAWTDGTHTCSLLTHA